MLEWIMILTASAGTIEAGRAADPDCRPQMILASAAPMTREPTPQNQRPRQKPQQPRGQKPCVVLSSA